MIPPFDSYSLTALVLFAMQQTISINGIGAKSPKLSERVSDIYSRIRNFGRSHQLTPVVLIPGLGSSNLIGQISKPNAACEELKLGETYVSPRTDLGDEKWIDCWAHLAKLNYNPKTGFTSSNDGVQVYASDFGTVEGVEFLSNRFDVNSNTFGSLVKQAVAMGYERNQNIRGAPYDFRRCPVDNPIYFAQLKKLVVRMFHENNGAKVSIVAHSLGNYFALHFLQTQTHKWKQTYIKNYVFVAGPIGGGFISAMTLKDGSAAGCTAPCATLEKIRDIQRTWPVFYDTLPRAKLFGEKPVIITANASYGANDYEKLYNEIGFPEGKILHRKFYNSTNTLKSPGVQVHCLYGTGYPTDTTYPPNGVTEDSDGLVTLRISEICALWRTQQKESVVIEGLAKATHTSIVREDVYVEAILNHVNGAAN